MKSVLEFASRKIEGRPISMVTCYDFWSAKIINTSEVDCILVGDSSAMVMHGHPSTLQATIEMLAHHTAAVVRGAPDKFVIADMPFLTVRKDLKGAMDCVEKLMTAGAQAIKIEGIYGHEEITEHIIQSGIPVMGHLGLTPQSIYQFGGFKVQGKEELQAQDLIMQASALEKCGCFALVLECVPVRVSGAITQALKIPTIGIGAGAVTDGQVLVLQDLLGAQKDFKPKFLRTYCDLNEVIRKALNSYDADVKGKTFPAEKETYL